MDMQQIDFSEYKFDPIPYARAIETLAKQIHGTNFEANQCSKSTFDQIDALIGEKTAECSQIAEEIKNVRNDNLKMQIELESLKKEEAELSSTHVDLKEVLKNICKVTFVQDNEKFRTITQKIQRSLGFKLKLLQCHDNQHLWIATFLFDVSNESESNHFVVVLYNNETSTFACTLINYY
ncbi:uncharacterized protein LOC116342634 [Contarinia nasturtii]|uniref:uncharacterized protein LOC116342634 n=1 Tax=Contarinia nasturtii TaxID=265458 RepID=UPI0012D49BBE|nr:uncharacterized protein LOC116342634 [Contarinia nasturtii]